MAKRPASGGSDLKRNLGLSDSEGPRYPLKIRFGVFRGLQRLPSGHKEVAGSPLKGRYSRQMVTLRAAQVPAKGRTPRTENRTLVKF